MKFLKPAHNHQNHTNVYSVCGNDRTAPDGELVPLEQLNSFSAITNRGQKLIRPTITFVACFHDTETGWLS